MVFSSETFLFMFFPLFLALYYLTPNRFRSATILAGSYAFYAWWRIDFLGLLILTTIWTFVIGRAVGKHRGTDQGKWLLALGVAGCLCVLGIFKYLNFFIDSFAALVGTDAAGLGIEWRLILPIGISFYIFQSISYLIDVHRGDASSDARLIDFAAFIALFPQLIAGPILRYKDLEHQFTSRVHSFELFCDGMARFVVGLAMKVLIADSVAPLADLAFENSGNGFVIAWLGSVAYMIQLFFDFAGYSAMAIGLGMMMGFRFIENFNMPYTSRTITEFWRRWHISLSVWLRDYLYIPLGGNRFGTTRTYINLMIVMTLGGLWHGASWTFVLWGIWHGGILAIERATGHDRKAATLLWGRPVTLLAVLLGWVMFRSVTVPDAFDVYAGMIGMQGVWPTQDVWLSVTGESMALLIIAIILVVAEPHLTTMTRNTSANMSAPGGVMVADGRLLAQQVFLSGGVTVLCILTVMKLAEQNFSPFLYFQF